MLKLSDASLHDLLKKWMVNTLKTYQQNTPRTHTLITTNFGFKYVFNLNTVYVVLLTHLGNITLNSISLVYY